MTENCAELLEDSHRIKRTSKPPSKRNKNKSTPRYITNYRNPKIRRKTVRATRKKKDKIPLKEQ